MYNVVVIVNGGKNVISRHLLDEIAKEAGADTWECIDLPTDSQQEKRTRQNDVKKEQDVNDG